MVPQQYERRIGKELRVLRVDGIELKGILQEVHPAILKAAVEHTARKRDSLEEIRDWKEIAQEIRQESALIRLWDNYTRDNDYAAIFQFDEVVDTIEAVGTMLDKLDAL